MDLFLLSDEVVALYMGNSTAKAYSNKQGHAVFLFLSRLAFYILNLVDKHIPTHFSMEADCLSHGK